jgi:hydrogenase maturation protease
MRTIIIGLGNPLLGDDGAGWRIVDRLRDLIVDSKTGPSGLNGEQGSPIEIDYLSNGGLALMERLVGYDRAILVDALNSGHCPQGTVVTLRLEDLPDRASGHLGSAHDTSLQTAMQMGRTMGVPLPGQVTIIAVETQNVYEFSEELTPAVAGAVEPAVQAVLKALSQEILPT